MRFNLLAEPLIQSDAGWHSLPGLMAAMARGEVRSFAAMRPHQRPAWHMFLVQLATLALDAVGEHGLPTDEAGWTAAMRALTPDHEDDAPWHLVVEDGTKPAFLQPPDPGGLKWNDVETPDALDMLITARNHDVKTAIARSAAPQDWVLALVSLQTMEGGNGRKKYGIARMNGAASSRAMLTLAPLDAAEAAINPSMWWQRDVQRLLEQRQGISGITLVWLEPWPEKQALALDALDPLFIEICRRVRLGERDNRLIAWGSSSEIARIAAKEAYGVVTPGADPWAPILIEGKKVKTLTLNDRDWTYDFLVQLLHGKNCRRPYLSQPSDEEQFQPMAIVAEAFARGQSKTDGFRSRIVPVPKGVLRGFWEDEVIDLSKALIEDVGRVETALRYGLERVAFNGDKEKHDQARKNPKERAKLAKKVSPMLFGFQHFADQHFFPALWDQMQARGDAERAQARIAFVRKLARAAEREFHAAMPAIPCARIMRTRAELRGEQALRRGLIKAISEIDAEEKLYGT
ncbi:hypothetical protein [Roseovarius sp. ZX-A-9]|uniref:hypothetical protein n=1 Tax=Roseovarius sp. ZX-A-9 TaxID=3014783 RepID=UPI00232C4432|nr:hypothetical protein [Roseovarius sp. ZX-A-9]